MDANTPLHSSDVNPQASTSIRLPDEPPPHLETVIVLKKTTVYYTVFVFILLVGTYTLGWAMGASSARGTSDTIRAAVNESLSTAVANLPGNAGGGAAAQPQQPPTQDPNRRFSISEAGNPTLGPENAPVTIIEFSDFQCPFCKRFQEDTFRILMKTYEGKIRFVYRDFPLDSIHPYARGSAEAAQCANDQKRFWEYHDLLFRDPQRQTKDDLLAYAKQLGLEMTAFQSCLDNRKYAQEVQGDYATALSLGLNGTPSFFINGRLLVGAQPFSAFAAYIEAELAAASSSPAAVTPTTTVVPR